MSPSAPAARRPSSGACRPCRAPAMRLAGMRASWVMVLPTSFAIRMGTSSRSTTRRSGTRHLPSCVPPWKNQAQRFPARGVNVRRLDHFNCLAADVKANRTFFEDYLGFRLTEQIVLDDGTEAGMWLTCSNKSYDFAYTREA